MTEVDGLKLRLSSLSNTGYFGVSKKQRFWKGAPYVAAFKKTIHLGAFATAVEAAVAYAKRAEAERVEQERKRESRRGKST